uniref:Uncharacterized protein n=1 Tax=Anopheles darlingi TaxID=43151 RepID=A0A2M4DDT6_ANODA
MNRLVRWRHQRLMLGVCTFFNWPTVGRHHRHDRHHHRGCCCCRRSIFVANAFAFVVNPWGGPVCAWVSV